MDKKETLLLKIESDNKKLKSIISESISLIGSLSSAVKQSNTEIKKTNDELLWATNKLRNIGKIAEKPITIQTDLKQLDSMLKKIESIGQAFKSLERISLTKAQNVAGGNIGGFDLKQLANLGKYNKEIQKLIANLEKLKEVGKEVNINVKGLEGLSEVIKHLNELLGKLKLLETDAKKIKKSLAPSEEQTFMMVGKKHAVEFENSLLNTMVAAKLLASAFRKAFQEIVAVIGWAVDEVLKFEKAIYALKTVTQEQLGNFTQTATTVLNAATQISADATKAAAGIQTVYAAGIEKATDAVEGYQEAQMASVATQANMNDLINFGVIANNNYQASVKDWATLFNKIAVAATSSKLDIADFAKQGGTIAAAFAPANVSLDESLALVSSFGNYLRNASEATVAATNMVKKMMQPTQEMQRIIKDINKQTLGIGQKVVFSPSAIASIDGTLEGYIRNFNKKLTAFAEKNKMNVNDIIASMFKEMRASRGLQQAFSSIFSGEFGRIKTNIQKETDFIQQAYEEAMSSILQKFENLQNSVSSKFKELFVRFQPEAHQLFSYMEDVLNQIISYIHELVRDLGILNEQGDFSEQFKTMAIGLGEIVKRIAIILGDLVRFISSTVTVILKAWDTLTYGIASVATTVSNLDEIWRIAKEQGRKGVENYFKDQLDTFKTKSKEFLDSVGRHQKNFLNLLETDFTKYDNKTTVDSKSDKKPGDVKNQDYKPSNLLSSFGDTQFSDIKDREQIEKDLQGIKDSILKNNSDTFTYERTMIKREYAQRLGDFKDSLDQKKITQAEYDEAIVLAKKDHDSKINKAYKEHLERIKQAEEAAKREYIKNTNETYNAKIDTLNKELNEVEAKANEEGVIKSEALRRTNNKLSQIAQEYKNKAGKFVSGTPENTEALKQASAIYEKIEKNKTVIAKESLKERLSDSENSYKKEIKALQTKAELEDASEDKRLNNIIARNNTRVKEIQTTLKTELGLNKAQKDKLIEEEEELTNQIKLDMKKRSDDKKQIYINNRERELESERNLNESKSNLNQISQREYLQNLIELNQKEIKLIQDKNDLITKDDEERKNNLAQINALIMQNTELKFQKEMQLVDDYMSIFNQIAQAGNIMSQFSNRTVQGFGEIVNAISDTVNQSVELGKAFFDLHGKSLQLNESLKAGKITQEEYDQQMLMNSATLVISGINEMVYSVSNAIDTWDAYNKALGEATTTNEDLYEITLRNLKSFPLLGDALYSVTKQIYQATGLITDDQTREKIKNLAESIKTLDEALKNYWKEKNIAENEAIWENQKAQIEAQEDTFDNKMKLIDLEEARQIEAAKKDYKSEKQLELKISTIKLQSAKKRNDLLKEDNQKVFDKKQEMYEKELDMIDKIYGKHKEKLAGEIEGFQQKIKELTQQIQDVESEFYDNRAKEAEKTSQRYSVFTSALSQRKGDLASSFFRANQLEMDIRSSLESSKAQEEYERTGNFVQYQARMAKMALDKFAYLQNKLNDTIDPQERADMEKELISIRQEYYNFAFDKEKEAMEEKKRQLEEEKKDNEAKLLQKQAEIDKVTKAELAALDQVNKAYEQSGNYWLTTMINRTNTWMDYAKTQAKDLFSESKDEVGKLFQEFEKIKAKVFSEISGKTSNTSTSSGGGGSFNQINTNAPAYTSSSSTVSTPSLSSSSAPFAVGLNAMLGQINNSSSNPAPGSSNVIDPDIQKANVIRDIARNNPGFSEQYFFDKYFSFPLETIRDVARQQMIKGYYKNGTPYVPEDGTYYLHQGERVLTEKENRNYSSQNMVVNFYNQISGVKLDSSENIQKAVNNLESNMTRQLQKEMRVNNTL